MTHLWGDLRAAVPSMLQGWRLDSFSKRGRHDFGVSPALKQLFADVGRNPDLANAIVDQLGHVPQGRQFVLAVKVPSVLGILLYLVIAFGAAISVEFYVENPGVKLLLMILSIAAACALLLFTLVRELRMQARFADALLINRLLRAVEAAQLVENDPLSVDKRYFLARAIRGAADQLRKGYPPPSVSLRAAPFPLRQVRREAKRCSSVLNSYGVAALSGDREEIRALKEDFVRAILRVGTGNWSQIVHLQPLVTVKRSWGMAVKRSLKTLGLLCSLIGAPVVAGIITEAIVK
ncbi:hypothetical protein ABIB35_001254 [Arthrobacter sp. UYP6]|uniref:hypothetical protein n=1 Tax=Arthrobacter sp. UYP6 TaxID=1756378 RepID=UPI00339A7154